MPGIQAGGGFENIGWLLGVGEQGPTLNLPGISPALSGIAQVVADTVWGVGQQVLSNFGRVIQAYLNQFACFQGNTAYLTMADAFMGAVEQYLGADLSQFRTPGRQQRNYACPVDLPGVAEAARAWLSNEIDQPTLECWVRAANGRFPEFFRAIRASRAKLSALDYGMLFLRDKIGQQDLTDRIRELGFIQPNDQQNVMDLLKQIPPPSDIVRMMVRDAADDQLVQQFNLDADFNNKFAGQLKDWARNQGIDPLYMQYLWRAHWSIPAPGQLAEMLHRLSRLPQNDPAYVDQGIIRTALEQQDIAPFWIDKFIAISYRPLTRIDARRAFEIGALDKNGLREAYLDLGYAPDKADTLVEFNARNVQRTLLKNPAVGQYAKGEITLAEMESLLTDAGADSDTIQLARQRATLIADQQRRKVCLGAYKKRFSSGEWDDSQALALLTQQGLDADQAAQIVAGWRCVSDSKGKAFSMSVVVDLYSSGLIDEQGFITRLVNLGFDRDDAALALRNVQRKLDIKATKAQADAVAKAQREADRLNRLLQREANQQARQQQQLLAQTAKARSVRELRQKRILGAGEKWSTHSGEDLPTGIMFVRAMYNAAVSNTTNTFDEIIAALTTIAGDKAITSRDQFEQALATALANETP